MKSFSSENKVQYFCQFAAYVSDLIGKDAYISEEGDEGEVNSNELRNYKQISQPDFTS